jgi:hypothetical protein
LIFNLEISLPLGEIVVSVWIAPAVVIASVAAAFAANASRIP